MPVDRFNDYALTAVGALLSLSAAVGTWLVRRILTNQQQIECLRREVATREAQRESELRMWQQMQIDIRELRHDVRTLFNNGRRTDD